MSNSDEPCNIDPSVAALLLDLPETASYNDVKVRMGMIRLSQARIHGNATYAATILQHAFAESKQSQQVHGLLVEKLSMLERRLTQMPIGDDHDDDVCNEQRQASSTTVARPNADAVVTPNANDAAFDDADTVPVRVVLEESFTQCLLFQISNIEEDRKLLKEQENRLRDRLKGLERLIEETDPGNNEWRSAFASSREYTVPSCSIECVVCRTQAAEMAIIPCGHLCLCDGCTKALVASSSILQYCPLCRGSLLSTLRIYIPK
jgi:Zinc finger, C3HC4 type (RING finger)